MSLDASIGASLAWYPQIDVAGSPTSSWGWAERLPLVELPLALYVGEALKLEGSLELKEDHNAIRNDMVPANGSTLIEDARYIDYTFPFRALASWERSPVSASMGRDTLRWGPGQSGTLLVSDEPDFYDYLQYGFSSPVLAYRFLWLSLDGALANNDYYPDTIAYSSVPWTKNLFVHRWDIKIGRASCRERV